MVDNLVRRRLFFFLVFWRWITPNVNVSSNSSRLVNWRMIISIFLLVRVFLLVYIVNEFATAELEPMVKLQRNVSHRSELIILEQVQVCP